MKKKQRQPDTGSDQQNESRKSKKLFKILITALKVLAVVFAIIFTYMIYVLIAFHRLGNARLTVGGSASDPDAKEVYTVMSYNIGFGAYEADYSFFMDGGKRSWAWSEERLDKNLTSIAALLGETNADLYVVQEVDFDSTRSYRIDERVYLQKELPDYAYTFAQNYDSPFLFYPLTQPHGASKSGLMTFSRYTITSSERIELPIEKGLRKLVDLDRCYSKNRIQLPDGKELVLYNLHLSAYTSDGKIAAEQLQLLISDMEEEYAKGVHCVAGGDFNKDILGNSEEYFGKADKEYTWAQPLPEGIFDGYHVSLVAPLNEEDPVPSCRNADAPYHEGQLVLTVDGFLVTDNLTVISSEVVDTGFKYSDHNPVLMSFSFND